MPLLQTIPLQQGLPCRYVLSPEKVSGPDSRHEGPSSHRGVAVKMDFGEEAELDWGRKLYPFYVQVTSVDLSGYARSAKLLGEEGDKASKFLENWRKYASDRERSKQKQESLTAQLSGLVAESRASPGEDIMRRRWELRRQRDEEERKMLDITQLLYASWMQLKLIREWQGFTSTPWILKAVPATMDPADDEKRCSREKQEESQEVSVLQSLPPAEALAAVSERWAKTKRQPGEPQYDMRLIYDDQCITADHKLDSPLEIERRERARKIRAYLTASLDGGTEVRSEFELPLTDIYTWSLGELPLGDAVHCQRASPDPPVVAAAGAFSFAVHTMPNLLTLRVYVSHIESRWQLLVPRSLRLAMGRTRVAAEAVVNVKTTVGGKQVTHVYQQHHFAENLTVLADGAKEDSEHSGITTGVLTWPDAATSSHSGYVVPPIIGSGGTVHDEEPKDMETMSNTPRGADDSTEGVLQGDLAEYFDKRYCWLPLAAGEDGSAMWRSARLMMLRERAEGRLLGEYGNVPIPAFDRELPAHLRRRSTQGTDEHETSRAKTPRRSSTSGSLTLGVEGDDSEREGHIQDFIDRVRARSQQHLQIKSVVTYRSVVQECEIDLLSWLQWAELLYAVKSLFTPYRPLRPAPRKDPRLSVNATKQVDLHIQVIQVTGLPKRRADDSWRRRVSSYNPASGFASYNAFNHGFSSTGFGGAGRGQEFAGMGTSTFPEIVVEARVTDFHGEMVSEVTRRVPAGGLSGTADVNQKIIVPFMRPRDVEVPSEDFAELPESVHLNVFDERSVVRTLRDGYTVRTDTERRFLGSFSLPLSSIFNSPSAVDGTFRLDTPAVTLGYSPAESQEEFSGSHIVLSATINPLIAITQRQQQDITPGAEPRAFLNHVQRWLERLRSAYPKSIVEGSMALGTDLDGRSVLACRYVAQPLTPPPEVTSLDDPHAIERAARFVSMIPFLTDDQIFSSLKGSTKLNLDVWCTPQNFIDIRAGDWEEHATLLCSYFKRIDTHRRLQSSNYPVVESSCIVCRYIADEKAMFVLRRDTSSGHCEIWQPASGECFFLPNAGRPSTGSFADSLRRFLKDPAAEDTPVTGEKLRATPYCSIRRVIAVFNDSNVWFYRKQQLDNSARRFIAVNEVNWDPASKEDWEPLLPEGAREALLESESIIPIQADGIKYNVISQKHIDMLQTTLQSRLESNIRQYRSCIGTGLTRLDSSLRNALMDICDLFEKHAQTDRISGNESVFPLKPKEVPEVTGSSLEQALNGLDQLVGDARVFGVPINVTYTDVSTLWQKVVNTGVLDPVGQTCDFAVAVRVFSYPANVLSVWAFVVCCARD
ncbi:Coiled-coil and C2 domain-containing protein 2A [Perkinsus olseni]|uniref:Coiled-coil and C2 domain-containing protein 2A n=3 Tax=Perkinsus olseni TaxID=32597 RepID=A0A7J6QKP9_PEROL|nr:Coiled-coil and C2 domain-containing protein 2A [Perkinsus olseni]